jgi:hypothetical protein
VGILWEHKFNVPQSASGLGFVRQKSRLRSVAGQSGFFGARGACGCGVRGGQEFQTVSPELYW